MKSFCVIIFIGFTLPVIGQKNCADLEVILGEIRAKRRAESYKEALIQAQNTLQLAQKMHCEPITGSCYNEIGICYQEIQQYDSSDTAYQLALNIRTALKDQRGQANIYQNLMSLKIAAEHPIDADEYGKKALSIFEKISDTLGMARIYSEYSNFFAWHGDPRALEYNLKSLDLAERAKNDTIIAENALSLGNRYFDELKYDSSIFYYQKAFDYSTRLNQSRLRMRAMNGLGLATWGLGNLKDSEKYFKTALSIYRPNKDVGEIFNTYSNLSLLYQVEGDWEKVAAITDSLFIIGAETWEISRDRRNGIYTTVRNAIVESALSAKKRKEERNKWLLAFCCVLILSYMYLKEERKKKKQLELKMIEQQQHMEGMILRHNHEYIEKRLRNEIITRKKIGHLLHSNIGGHLIALHNRMEGILSLLHGETQLEERIKAEVSAISYIHEEARRLSRTIEKSELDAEWLRDLRRFCDIHNNTHNAKPKMQLILNNMGEPVPTRIAETLYSVTMALIGNTLKWANANLLEIQISNTGDEVALIVSDDGIGFDENNTKKGQSQGLRNIHDQINDVGGEIHINSINGCEVIISVPLKNELFKDDTLIS